MIKKLFLASAFLIGGAASAQAAELAISFNNKSAQIALQQQITDYDQGRSVVGIRGLYNDRKDTELVSASFAVLGPIVGTGLEIGAGVRGYYVNSRPEDDKIATGGLGGLIRFVPPALPKASFSGSLFYCPQIFTAMDGEKLWDVEISAAFAIAPQATVFVTLTEIEAEFEDHGDRTLDKTFRAGLSLRF